MTSEIQLKTSSIELSTTLNSLSESLSAYLKYLGLPTDSVLVGLDERRKIINNMPYVVPALTEVQRSSAMYISKFSAACVVGLFDAALNYLWDETIRNLRVKVVQFDLDYFYDTAIADANKRSKFKDEGDLEKLDDWVLVKGCRETGIISDIGYRHLDYIRDMRNHASAAHPNQNELTGLQLAAWLETCIKEVLGKEPEGAAIEVKRLLRSLREESLSERDIPPIAEAIVRLPEELAHSLLRTAFGMYTDPKLDASIRKNIRFLAPEIWSVCSEDAKYDVGLKHGSFSANGEVSRVNLARDFLIIVDGAAYLSSNTIAVEITSSLDALLAAHNGWHNFYNGPSPARLLQSFIPASGNIPNSVSAKYVKILTLCYIGNGYGVSSSAEPTYIGLIDRWQDSQNSQFIGLTRNLEITSRLQFASCQKRFQGLASRLTDQATDPNTKLALKFIEDFSTKKLDRIGNDSRSQTILKTIKY
ncbi:MAG: hypothetical protein AAGG51_26165 [Cyanobacteria bacterium P01_G01_bin.54]